MRVTYAIHARIAGGGIGNTAHNALKAIYRRRWLTRLMASSLKTNEFAGVDVREMGLPGRGVKWLANYDRSKHVDEWSNALFDHWVARQIPECEIFHGWSNHALHSVRAAHKRGAKTIVERGGSHVAQNVQLIQDEYRRWGWQASVSGGPLNAKSLREFDESDYVMVPSQYNVDSFTARGFPRERLLLLPLGVDTGRYSPQKDGGDSNIFRAIFVGQVSLRKGIQYVLEGWRKAALPNAELIVAGEVKADAAAVIERYRRDSNIRWQGHVTNPLALYQSAHVFVFPSIEEGSALVTYEAMACGLPSIITHNAGSLVRDGIDGFIVPLGNSDAIAEKLCRLHQNPHERAALGRNARANIEPMTWAHYGERLLGYYEQIAGHDTRPSRSTPTATATL